MNPYINYYVNQAGSGIAGFAGTRDERGRGFFGKLFSSTILPILKYFDKSALTTGVNVAEDVLEGKNIKEVIKSKAIESGKNITRDAIERSPSYIQKGSGKRKRKIPYSKRKKSKVNRKRPRKKSEINFLE